MTTQSKLVGQGAYGCVYKPSLRCADKPDLNYDGTVSKLMFDVHATKELTETEKISAIDPSNNFHLGKPIPCKPMTQDNEFNHLKQMCDISSLKVANPARLSLLIMKDGGYNLKTFCKYHLNTYITAGNSLSNMLHAVRGLFEGLVAFQANDLIHYDLKPQNIMFNPNTGRFYFIDFGFAQNKIGRAHV